MTNVLKRKTKGFKLSELLFAVSIFSVLFAIYWLYSKKYFLIPEIEVIPFSEWVNLVIDSLVRSLIGTFVFCYFFRISKSLSPKDWKGEWYFVIVIALTVNILLTMLTAVNFLAESDQAYSRMIFHQNLIVISIASVAFIMLTGSQFNRWALNFLILGLLFIANLVLTPVWENVSMIVILAKIFPLYFAYQDYRQNITNSRSHFIGLICGVFM